MISACSPDFELMGSEEVAEVGQAVVDGLVVDIAAHDVYVLQELP